MPLQSAGGLIAHPSDILSLISTFSQDQFILSIYALPNTLNLSKALRLQATARALDGHEHSFNEGLPELVDDIKSL